MKYFFLVANMVWWIVNQLVCKWLLSTIGRNILLFRLRDVCGAFPDDAYLNYINKGQWTFKIIRWQNREGHLKDRFDIIRLEDGRGWMLSIIVHSRLTWRNIRLCIWKMVIKKYISYINNESSSDGDKE